VGIGSLWGMVTFFTLLSLPANSTNCKLVLGAKDSRYNKAQLGLSYYYWAFTIFCWCCINATAVYKIVKQCNYAILNEPPYPTRLTIFFTTNILSNQLTKNNINLRII
jgi:hypothetical protein